MMNENKTPLQLLTDALASMTERAMKAEQERDEAKRRQLDWYKNWEAKDKECKEAQRLLADEIRAHQKTTAELDEATKTVSNLCDTIDAMNKAKILATEP